MSNHLLCNRCNPALMMVVCPSAAATWTAPAPVRSSLTWAKTAGLSTQTSGQALRGRLRSKVMSCQFIFISLGTAKSSCDWTVNGSQLHRSGQNRDRYDMGEVEAIKIWACGQPLHAIPMLFGFSQVTYKQAATRSLEPERMALPWSHGGKMGARLGF